MVKFSINLEFTGALDRFEAYSGQPGRTVFSARGASAEEALASLGRIIDAESKAAAEAHKAAEPNAKAAKKKQKP